MALRKTLLKASHDENGLPVEAIIYEKDFVVTRRIDIVSLRKRKVELEKELDEINRTILEIVAFEA